MPRELHWKSYEKHVHQSQESNYKFRKTRIMMAESLPYLLT